MDLATLGGVIAGGVLLLFGIIVNGLSPFAIMDAPSALITFGGGLAAAVTASPLSRLMNVGNFTKFAFLPKHTDIVQLILTLVQFSERARREGLLSLEDDLANLDEPFLKKGIQLVVDGTDPELVRNILETDMNNIKNRHQEGVKFWGDSAMFLPAFGMIGTLVGLVQMLLSLGTGDPNAIGKGMSAALITTLYGSIGANMFCIPFQKKLEHRSGDEMTVKAIMVEGILSIQQGDNPRIVKDKLSSFLPPAERDALDEGAGAV